MKIGIIGCGAVANRWYLPGLANSNICTIVAICDNDLSKAKNAAKKYNISKFYSSMEEMVANENLDLVVILTRHSDHFDHVKFILDNNIHVYCEKPLSQTSQEVKMLIDLAESKSLVLGCAPQVMLSSRNIKLKELIKENLIGKISLIRISNSNMGPSDRKGIDYDPEWFYQDGGSMASLGIYSLATLIWIFGLPRRVVGFSGIAFPFREVKYGPYIGKKFEVSAPDNQVMLLDFNDGCFGLFDGSYSVMTPPPYEFEIHGDLGSLFISGFGGPESILLKLREQQVISVGPSDNCHLNWNLSWGVEETIRAIQEKRKPVTDPYLSLDLLLILEALKTSNKENIIIQLHENKKYGPIHFSKIYS